MFFSVAKIDKNVKIIEGKYTEIETYINYKIANNAALETNIRANLETLDGNNAEVKGLKRDIDKFIGQYQETPIVPFTLADADAQYLKAKEDYKAAKETLQRLSIFDGLRVANAMPETEDAKTYKEALQVKAPPIRRSLALQSYIEQAAQPLKEILQLNETLKTVNGKLEALLQAKSEKEKEQQQKELEKQQQGTAPAGPQQKPQTTQKPQTQQQITKPQPQQQTKPNNANIPTW